LVLVWYGLVFEYSAVGSFGLRIVWQFSVAVLALKSWHNLGSRLFWLWLEWFGFKELA